MAVKYEIDLLRKCVELEYRTGQEQGDDQVVWEPLHIYNIAHPASTFPLFPNLAPPGDRLVGIDATKIE